ncbi:hypothetical protein C8Q76DRAFT_301342 [Earliella scabrosa]|nr:hypothetical protein C8Q76DRAFT_301342 [Earliella scabrosa]
MFGRVSCCLLFPVSSLCRRWSLLYLFPSRFRSWSSSSLPKATDILLPPSSRLSTSQLKRRPNTSSPRQDDPSTSPRAIARGPGKFSLPLRVGTRRHLTPSLPEGTCSALGARRINKPLFLRGRASFLHTPQFFPHSSFGKNILFFFFSVSCCTLGCEVGRTWTRNWPGYAAVDVCRLDVVPFQFPVVVLLACCQQSNTR